MVQETTQEVLDSSQYSISSIQQYEAVYGEDFVSPGGYEMAVELIRKMQLEPGARVLDVGCGLGGSAFVMAREFGFFVDGIDLSNNMLTIANAKLANAKLASNGLSDQVRLEHGDCLELDRPGYYDAIYSRDVFLHIHDKSRLFGVLKKSMRSGGQLLFTDYCCGDKPWSSDFSDYVEDRGYCLHTLDEYAGLIKAAGFQQVKYQDLTDQFIAILRSDLARITSLDIPRPDCLKLEKSWQGKLERSLSGDHCWGLFTAVSD